MSIAMQMSFDEAAYFLQQSEPSTDNQVILIFDDKQQSMLSKMKEKLSHSLEKEKVAEIMDFTQFPAFGMWADREDMRDSTEYVRKLRREQWRSTIDK